VVALAEIVAQAPVERGGFDAGRRGSSPMRRASAAESRGAGLLAALADNSIFSRISASRANSSWRTGSSAGGA
jgi:hypothetical protein